MRKCCSKHFRMMHHEILLVKWKNRWQLWWMGSLMKWTSCVGARQVCTQVSMWLWLLAAVEYLVFFEMNKNINLKNLKHFYHRCHSYNHKSKHWIFWIKANMKMNEDVYSWGCFSKLFLKRWIHESGSAGWQRVKLITRDRMVWGGGGREKKRKIEGSILINNHL